MGSSTNNLSELRVSPTAFSKGAFPPRLTSADSIPSLGPASSLALSIANSRRRHPHNQVAQSHTKPDPNGPGVGLGRGTLNRVTGGPVDRWTGGPPATNVLLLRDFAHSELRANQLKPDNSRLPKPSRTYILPNASERHRRSPRLSIPGANCRRISARLHRGAECRTGSRRPPH
jgi:hypothetical protein